MNKNRLLELDAIRGLAALAVVLFHYLTRYDELFGQPKNSILNFKYGEFGVNLFFIVSGFVIYMSIKNQIGVKEFAIKRAIRLYPAYIFSVILTFLLVTIYGLQGRQVSLFEAILNLTMLQGFIPGVDNVDGVYWTLVIELTFYILIGILILLGLIRQIEVMSLSWLGLAGAIKIASYYVDNGILNIIEVLAITNYCHLFVAGIMFYKLRENGKLNHHFILLTCLLYECVFNDFTSNFFVAAFFIVFYLVINNKLRLLRVRPLLFLGTISYSLYLVHQNIGYIIIEIMRNIGFNNDIPVIIAIIVSIGIATIITFYIEKPIQKYLSCKIRKLPKEIIHEKSA